MTMRWTALSARSRRLAMGLMGLACALSVGAAWVAQHHFNMQPCPWCILQRMLFVVLAALGVLGALLPDATRRVMAGLAMPWALSGMAAALWQHFVAAKTASCAMTLADRIIMATTLDQHLPDWFEVRATCADAAVDVLGVPFEFWSLALFALSAGVLLLNVLPSTRRA
jgi:disulfide bond formation protein DsbB